MIIQNYKDLKDFIVANASLDSTRKPNHYTESKTYRMGVYTFTICETNGYDLWLTIYNDKLKKVVLEAEAELAVGPECVKDFSLFAQFKKDIAKLMKKMKRYNEIMRRLGGRHLEGARA